jgi:ATP-dependent Clp protease ATP-binding subunit ClpC
MAGVFDFFKKQPTEQIPESIPAAQPASVPVVPVIPAPTMTNGIVPPTMPVTPVPPTKAADPVHATTPPEQVSKTNTPKPLGSNIQSTINPKKREDLDLMTHLTQRSNRVFVAAQTKATELGNQFVDSEHLLHGLLTDAEIYKLFTEQKIAPQLVDAELTKIYKKEQSKEKPQFAPRIKQILDNALVIARKLGFDFISPEHILLALYEEGEGVGARILAQVGLKKEELNKKIIGKKEGLENPGEKEEKKSVLESFTKDLTAKASQGLLDPVVERSEVIERAIHILSRRTKNNPALVGEAGVGKTAIVEGLAEKIVAKEVPESLLNKRILELDLMSLIAGASHRGEFEERMKNLIEEVTASKGQIILFIDEIHNLVGAGGGEGSLDASNFLKPSLARGELQVIGATTLTEYRKYIEKDPALERRFQPVLVPEPTEEAAIKMLKAIKNKYEAFHKVKIPDEAIEAAVQLSKRYIGDRFLPDKAVDLIDEAAAAVRLPLISLPEEIRSVEERISSLNQEMMENKKSGNRVKESILAPKLQDLKDDLKAKQDDYNLKKGQTTTVLTSQIIKDIVAKWTGIPVSKISSSESEKLVNLEDIMHERLVNQEVAVTAVAQAVRRGRAGLKSTQKPIGSFVFLGPTGVGKTELAKTLADILFGTDEAIIRLDMTEYMEKHEVAKLLGAPPGYVGYDEGGKLTEAVRRKPYSVVLFDEVEKAHPDIFNILLQILDDGRLTDNKGHTVSFKNTVVICTSNLGSKMIQDELIKAGKLEIEEPPLLSTFAFSPRGRQIMTIVNNCFEKETNESAWKKETLVDYFAGQQIQSNHEDHDEIELPIHNLETHTISSKGVEMITEKNYLFYKTSTTTKTWEVSTLIDYFKDAVVINALPDAPEEQLPTSRLKTHAFSTNDEEIVSFKDRFWKRSENSTNWTTGVLKDYFQNNTISGGTFPINYWDIHTFSPTGDEYIIVGDYIWTRKAQTTVWLQTKLTEYFGKDFPLETELKEKSQTESSLAKNQYDSMKAKVMEELRSFFKPELINRFDEVIMFEPLKYIHMSKIAELQMKALRKLLEDQVIGFDWTENALKEITRVGFDPIYGARPLRRAIQKLVENPISTFIIEQKAVAGDKIIVDFDGENFIFNTQKVEFESSLNYTPINPDTGAKLSKDTSVLPKEPPKTEPTPTAPPSATIDTSFTAKAAIA